MTIKECYTKLGGDYDTAIRAISKESRIEKVLKMLPKDKSMDALRSALEQKDFDAAFRASHTLKGIFLNLCLSRQAKAAIDLTDALRERKEASEIAALFTQLEQSYNETLHILEKFVDEQATVDEEHEKK